MRIAKTRLQLASALLAWALAGASACDDSQAPAAGPGPNAGWLARMPAWPACPESGWRERWYLLRIQGRPAGGEHQRICEQPSGPRSGMVFEGDGRFAFMRDGARLEHRVRTRIWLDERGGPLRVSHKSSQPGQVGQDLEAGRIADELVAVRGPELRRTPFDPRALADPMFQRFLWAKAPIQAGQRLTFRSFSVRTAGYVDNTIEVTRHSPGPGGTTLIERTCSDAPGVTTWQTLDADLIPIRERADFGRVRIESELLSAPPARTVPSVLPDLSAHMRIKTTGLIRDPDHLVTARYRLTGLPAQLGIDALDGPGQRVVANNGDGVEVSVTRIRPETSPLPLMDLPPDPQRWLRPTALAQADSPEVRALAERLTRGKTDSLAAALSLRAWVAAEIKGDMGMTFASATDVLAAGRGDCSEKSVLLTALARAAGLPARAVAGLVYNEGGFAGHMWCELWLGHEWLPMDAAFGPEQVSAARIRIGVDPLELGDEDARATARMVVMVSGVEVKILEAETDDPSRPPAAGLKAPAPPPP